MQRLSPYAVLKEVASRQPDHDAIVFDDNSRITYGEFAERVTSLAGWLLNEGFVPGEAAGICIRDEINHLVASMAVLCMDTAQISLASHENATTRRALADRVGVTQLIVETPEAWMEGLRTIEMPATGTEVLRGFRSGLPDAVCQGRTIDSVAIYQNTSGSTECAQDLRPFRSIAFSDCQRVTQTMKKSDAFCAPDPSNSTPHRLHRLGLLLAGRQLRCFCATSTFRTLSSFVRRAEVTAIHMGGYKLGALVRSGTPTWTASILHHQFTPAARACPGLSAQAILNAR